MVPTTMVVVLLLIVAAAGYAALAIWARRAPRPARLGAVDGRLAPLPSTPNAVSTQADDPKRRMCPLPFRGDLRQTHDLLIELLRRRARVAIVTDTGEYIHAEFRTAGVGFIDDVEFYLNEASGEVHFRSASRLGYSDLGVNRKRMASLSEDWGARDRV